MLSIAEIERLLSYVTQAEFFRSFLRYLSHHIRIRNVCSSCVFRFLVFRPSPVLSADVLICVGIRMRKRDSSCSVFLFCLQLLKHHHHRNSNGKVEFRNQEKKEDEHMLCEQKSESSLRQNYGRLRFLPFVARLRLSDVI